MQVKCVICDKIDYIEDHSLLAKKLMNRKALSYLCQTCYDRITEKTIKRHHTGKFQLYSSKE